MLPLSFANNMYTKAAMEFLAVPPKPSDPLEADIRTLK